MALSLSKVFQSPADYSERLISAIEYLLIEENMKKKHMVDISILYGVTEKGSAYRNMFASASIEKLSLFEQINLVISQFSEYEDTFQLIPIQVDFNRLTLESLFVAFEHWLTSLFDSQETSMYHVERNEFSASLIIKIGDDFMVIKLGNNTILSCIKISESLSYAKEPTSQYLLELFKSSFTESSSISSLNGITVYTCVCCGFISLSQPNPTLFNKLFQYFKESRQVEAMEYILTLEQEKVRIEGELEILKHDEIENDQASSTDVNLLHPPIEFKAQDEHTEDRKLADNNVSITFSTDQTMIVSPILRNDQIGEADDDDKGTQHQQPQKPQHRAQVGLMQEIMIVEQGEGVQEFSRRAYQELRDSALLQYLDSNTTLNDNVIGGDGVHIDENDNDSDDSNCTEDNIDSTNSEAGAGRRGGVAVLDFDGKEETDEYLHAKKSSSVGDDMIIDDNKDVNSIQQHHMVTFVSSTNTVPHHHHHQQEHVHDTIREEEEEQQQQLHTGGNTMWSYSPVQSPNSKVDSQEFLERKRRVSEAIMVIDEAFSGLAYETTAVNATNTNTNTTTTSKTVELAAAAAIAGENESNIDDEFEPITIPSQLYRTKASGTTAIAIGEGNMKRSTTVVEENVLQSLQSQHSLADLESHEESLSGDRTIKTSEQNKGEVVERYNKEAARAVQRTKSLLSADDDSSTTNMTNMRPSSVVALNPMDRPHEYDAGAAVWKELREKGVVPRGLQSKPVAVASPPASTRVVYDKNHINNNNKGLNRDILTKLQVSRAVIESRNLATHEHRMAIQRVKCAEIARVFSQRDLSAHLLPPPTTSTTIPTTVGFMPALATGIASIMSEPNHKPIAATLSSSRVPSVRDLREASSTAETSQSILGIPTSHTIIDTSPSGVGSTKKPPVSNQTAKTSSGLKSLGDYIAQAINQQTHTPQAINQQSLQSQLQPADITGPIPPPPTTKVSVPTTLATVLSNVPSILPIPPPIVLASTVPHSAPVASPIPIEVPATKSSKSTKFEVNFNSTNDARVLELKKEAKMDALRRNNKDYMNNNDEMGNNKGRRVSGPRSKSAGVFRKRQMDGDALEEKTLASIASAPFIPRRQREPTSSRVITTSVSTANMVVSTNNNNVAAVAGHVGRDNNNQQMYVDDIQSVRSAVSQQNNNTSVASAHHNSAMAAPTAAAGAIGADKGYLYYHELKHGSKGRDQSEGDASSLISSVMQPSALPDNPNVISDVINNSNVQQQYQQEQNFNVAKPYTERAVSPVASIGSKRRASSVNKPRPSSHNNINSNNINNNNNVIIVAGSKPLSNVVQVRNALVHICMAGVHLEESRNEALQIMDTYARGQGILLSNEAPIIVNQFIIMLYHSKTLSFRALYALHPETGELYRIYGKGPRILLEIHIEDFFKFETASRCFAKLSSKTITATTDAVSVDTVKLLRK